MVYILINILLACGLPENMYLFFFWEVCLFLLLFQSFLLVIVPKSCNSRRLWVINTASDLWYRHFKACQRRPANGCNLDLIASDNSSSSWLSCLLVVYYDMLHNLAMIPCLHMFFFSGALGKQSYSSQWYCVFECQNDYFIRRCC